MSKHFFSDSDINYIIKKHFIHKEAVKNIATEFGVTHKVINRIIIQNGRTPVDWRKTWKYDIFTLKCAIALYNYGIGLRGVAERLDIGVRNLTTELRNQGVKIRTQSEQEFVKWSLMSKEQRINQVEACHKATLGVTPSEATLNKMAKSRQKNLNINMSAYEDEILKKLPFDNIIRQKAIGRYNIDFTIGNIAVEINGGNFHRFGEHALRHRERSKKIFDSGYGIVFIYIYKETCISSVSNQLISLINAIGTDKASIGKYWVIWSTPNLISTGCLDNIEDALISPTRNIRDRVTGRYKSIPR